MRGDLSETGVADVCRALGAVSADGILDIDGDDGRGLLVWRDGHVVAATSPTPRARLGDRLVGAGMLSEADLDHVLRAQVRAATHQRLGVLLVERGLVPQDAIRVFAQEQAIDAVFDVIRWRSGTYRFAPTQLADVAEVPLRIPVDRLLLEVSRREQEWTELVRVIPDLGAVPALVAGRGSGAASLEPDESRVLASISGVRSVRDLAADLGYGEFETARIVYGLTLLGIVELTLPEDEDGRALEEALRDLAGTDPAPWPPDEPAEDPSSGGDTPERAASDDETAGRGAAEHEAADEGGDAEHEAAEDGGAEHRTDVASAPADRHGSTDGDVAALLRELSRLAVDDQEPPPQLRRRPPPEPDRTPAPPRDGSRKRRRRFGRG